jgi:hypothetical protein
MIIFDYILKYNLIFRFYFIIIFIFNILIFYYFGIKIFFPKENINLLQDKIDNDLKYSLMLKKIIDIIKNPIIFEYQLKQSEKININSDKFINYYKYLNNIENDKLINSLKYYKKINILMTQKFKNKEKINIITKLLCINF